MLCGCEFHVTLRLNTQLCDSPPSLESWAVVDLVYPIASLAIDGHLWRPRWPERSAWPETNCTVCCVIRNQSHGYVATSRGVSCQTDANPLIVGWDSRNVNGKSQLTTLLGLEPIQPLQA